MMLVLSRKQGEGIVVDGPCVITVVQIFDNRVQIGLEADRSVGILRTEIADATKETPAGCDGPAVPGRESAVPS